MSASKDQYMESLLYDLHATTNDIVEQTNIQKEAIGGIKEDLQRLYHHIQQQQQEQEEKKNENI